MHEPPQNLDPARQKTDSGLHVERERSDAEHARVRTSSAGEADDRIRICRARNAALLRALRKLSDQHLGSARTPAERDAVARKRRADDRQEAEQEAAEDESIEREQGLRERSLAALVEAERAETNRLLMLERLRADELIEGRDEFLGIVAHDLRNLLGSITTYADLIKIGSDQSAEAAHRIQGIAKEMAVLVSDLLDVSAIAAGALRTELAEHDAAALARETVQTFGPLAAKKGVALTADTDPGLPRGVFDPARILQVLGNLLTNSIRHTQAGGRIEVGVTCDGEWFRLSVNDTGSGIPASRLKAIFGRFNQTPESGHHGLGLYIARGIVKAHGGKIWAESDAAGTTVSFTLPVRPELMEKDPEPEGPLPGRRG